MRVFTSKYFIRSPLYSSQSHIYIVAHVIYMSIMYFISSSLRLPSNSSFFSCYCFNLRSLFNSLLLLKPSCVKENLRRGNSYAWWWFHLHLPSVLYIILFANVTKYFSSSSSLMNTYTFRAIICSTENYFLGHWSN